MLRCKFVLDYTLRRSPSQEFELDVTPFPPCLAHLFVYVLINWCLATMYWQFGLLSLLFCKSVVSGQLQKQFILELTDKSVCVCYILALFSAYVCVFS